MAAQSAKPPIFVLKHSFIDPVTCFYQCGLSRAPVLQRTMLVETRHLIAKMAISPGVRLNQTGQRP